MEVEVERLTREIEEAELEQLTLEKERLGEETCIEQQCVVVLHGSKRAVEQHWRHCHLRVAQVGHLLRSQRGLQRGWTRGQGLSSLKRIAHACCIARETLCQWDPEGCTQSCRLC